MPTTLVLALALSATASLPPTCTVDGVAFELVAGHAEPGVARYRWAKHPERSITLTLVERDGFIAGSALLPDGVRRQALGPADHAITWIPVPEDGERPCAGAVDGTAIAGPAPQDGSLAGGCSDGNRVDVLILTTPAARTQAGGTNQLNALCDLAVASSNTAYINSGLAVRLRNVLRMDVDYVEQGFSSDLSSLAGEADGLLDEVHAIRDGCGADLVALIRTSGEYCGIGYLMPYNDAGASGTGFSVTAQSCLASQTFAHELGHNMGCCHANGDGGGCTSGGIFPYSVGWRFNGTNGSLYRTVMAYSPGSRIDHFSNPNVSFQGTPTGVEPSTDVQGAHNARSIGETLAAISSYRCEVPEALLGDCDANGRIDVLDRAQGRASDCDGNGLLDACEVSTQGACAVPGLSGCTGGFLMNAPGGQCSAGELFGRSVATDGVRFVVGSPGENTPQVDCGLAELWRIVNDRPEREATLRHSGPLTSDQAGTSVAILGNDAVVGAPGRDAPGLNSAGSVYVFRKNGTTWSQVQVLLPASPTVGGRFGNSVAMWGEWLAVGAPGDGSAPVGAGAVHVFRRQSNGTYVLNDVLRPTIAFVQGYFGWSVGIDGSVLCIGAPYASAGAGEVWASVLEGSSWSTPQRIGSPLETIADVDARLGWSVACTADAVIAGAPQQGDRQGAVFSWRRVDGAWQAGPVLSGPTQQGSRFGHGVAMSAVRVLVAQQDFATLASGVRAYEWPVGGTPAEVGRVSVGESVAIVRDLAIIGASESVESATITGAARTWRFVTDCDQDGVGDRCQIAQSGGDADANGILDACEAVIGDLDGDGLVNGADLGVLLGSWGTAGGDLNADGATDGADLGILLGNWTG
jgi:hypothetical protein